MASARTIDQDGFMTVNDNPLSKIGVFEYLGKSIPGAPDPDKIYKVYRPADELSDPECINSFKLQPWIDDHTMIGDPNLGLTAPEDKGIEGVIGEEVYFDGEYLRGNLKGFSNSFIDKIEEGKTELSLGYRCKYKAEQGEWKGEKYDFIQHTIRGNHVALVDEGRMGPEVSVMDHKMTFTFDSKDLIMDPKDKKDDKQATALDAGMQGEIMDMMKDALPQMMQDAMKPMMEGMMKDAMYGKEEAKDEDECEDGEEKDMEKDKEKSEGMDSVVDKVAAKVIAAMDAKIKPLTDKIGVLETTAADAADDSAKSELAGKVSGLLGTFDHADMKLDQVQDYALEKFGLDSADKSTLEKAAMIDVFLKTNRAPQSAQPTFGQDSADSKVNFRNYNKES